MLNTTEASRAELTRLFTEMFPKGSVSSDEPSTAKPSLQIPTKEKKEKEAPYVLRFRFNFNESQSPTTATIANYGTNEHAKIAKIAQAVEEFCTQNGHSLRFRNDYCTSLRPGFYEAYGNFVDKDNTVCHYVILSVDNSSHFTLEFIPEVNAS